MTELAIPQMQWVMTLQVTCSAPIEIGQIDGGLGRMIPITGGTVSGDNISGKVLAGGADWSVMRDGGLATVDAHYAFQCDDGAIIQIFNGATARITREAMERPYSMVTSPRFIAPIGAHQWLNEGVYIGTLRMGMGTGDFAVEVQIFRVV